MKYLVFRLLLVINNTFYPHKQQHKYPFENTRGQKSTIDYIITNQNIYPSKILDVRVLSSANTGTNHKLVLAKLRGCVQRKPKDKSIIVDKLNMEAISYATIKHLYQQRLKQKINENKKQNKDDVEAAWIKLIKDITSAAKKAPGQCKNP